MVGNKNTHRGQSFFDLHLRIYYCGDLKNFHLVLIPMFECHIAKKMFNMVVKFFDTLYGWWRDKLIKLSFDGEKTMTDHHFEFVTCMVQSASNKMLHVWCVPHQINIVVKALTESILDSSWIKFAYIWLVFFCGRKTIL